MYSNRSVYLNDKSREKISELVIFTQKQTYLDKQVQIESLEREREATLRLLSEAQSSISTQSPKINNEKSVLLEEARRRAKERALLSDFESKPPKKYQDGTEEKEPAYNFSRFNDEKKITIERKPEKETQDEAVEFKHFIDKEYMQLKQELENLRKGSKVEIGKNKETYAGYKEIFAPSREKYLDPSTDFIGEGEGYGKESGKFQRETYMKESDPYSGKYFKDSYADVKESIGHTKDSYTYDREKYNFTKPTEPEKKSREKIIAPSKQNYNLMKEPEIEIRYKEKPTRDIESQNFNLNIPSKIVEKEVNQRTKRELSSKGFKIESASIDIIPESSRKSPIPKSRREQDCENLRTSQLRVENPEGSLIAVNSSFSNQVSENQRSRSKNADSDHGSKNNPKRSSWNVENSQFVPQMPQNVWNPGFNQFMPYPVPVYQYPVYPYNYPYGYHEGQMAYPNSATPPPQALFSQPYGTQNQFIRGAQDLKFNQELIRNNQELIKNNQDLRNHLDAKFQHDSQSIQDEKYYQDQKNYYEIKGNYQNKHVQEKNNYEIRKEGSNKHEYDEPTEKNLPKHMEFTSDLIENDQKNNLLQYSEDSQENVQDLEELNQNFEVPKIIDFQTHNEFDKNIEKNRFQESRLETDNFLSRGQKSSKGLQKVAISEDPIMKIENPIEKFEFEQGTTPSKKAVLLEIGGHQSKPLSEIFKEKNKKIVQRIHSREDHVPKAEHKEKTKEELIEIRKQFVKVPKNEHKKSDLIEIKLDDKKGVKEPSTQLMERLAMGQRVKITKEEMLKLNKKNYQLLPEVKKRQEEEKKRLEKQLRLQKAKEYEKVIHN